MSEWKEYRLKDICDMFGRIGFRGYKESDIVEEGNGCITLSPSNMTEKGMNYSHCKYLSWFKYHESPEIQIQNGDVLFVKTGSSYGKTCYVDNLPLEATINPQILVLKNIKLNNKFFSLVLKTENILTQVKYGVVGSTIPTISQEKIGQFRFNTPSLSEQQRIVDYLDEKTKAIDVRISVLEKKSDAYTRLKASVINRAVTRGLNPNVSLKDSGIEWIGMIPEHWEVRRIKDLMKLLNGRAYLQPELQDEGKYRILRVGNFFTNDKWYYSDLELEASKYCEKGDLLFAWSASFGPFLWNEEKVIYHYHIWKVILNSQYDKQYAFQMFKAFSDAKRRDVHGSTMVHLTLQDMNQSYIPYPPLSEQQSIAAYLDTKCSEIDKAIDNIGKQIEALKRLKRSLINEVVTGKRKV